MLTGKIESTFKKDQEISKEIIIIIWKEEEEGDQEGLQPCLITTQKI